MTGSLFAALISSPSSLIACNSEISRRGEQLKVTVDRNICCGYGVCVETIDEVFAFDGEEKLTITSDIKLEWQQKVRFACQQCPSQALTLED